MFTTESKQLSAQNIHICINSPNYPQDPHLFRLRARIYVTTQHTVTVKGWMVD